MIAVAVGSGARRARRTVVSVISPAGTITQARRGASSLATKSSSEVAPVAPSASSADDRVGADVVDDARVPVAHQAAHDVGAHPAEADHAELHGASLYARQRDAGRLAAQSAPRLPRSARRGSEPSRRAVAVTGRSDALELHEADGAFERIEAWLRERGFFAPGGEELVRRPLPRLRALLDDPPPPLAGAARAVPAPTRRLCRPDARVCCPP